MVKKRKDCSEALVVLPRDVDRYRDRDNVSEVIARGTGLPPGDGDAGRAAVAILMCARQASLLGEAPERVSVVELETQTDVIAAEMLETQKRGVTRQRNGRWYFELKETED